MLFYVTAAVIIVLLAVIYVRLYNRLNKLRIKVEEGSADIDVALEKRFDLLNEEIEAVKKYLSHEYKLFTDVTALRTGADQEDKNRLQQQELTEEALKTIDAQIRDQSESMEKIKKQLDQSAYRINRRSRRNRKQEALSHAVREDALAQSAAHHDASVNQKVSLLASVHRDLSNVGANVDALSEQYPGLNSWISMDRFQKSIFDSEEHLQAARRFYNSNVSLYNQTLASIPWCIVAAFCHMEKADFYEVEEHKRNFTLHFD